MELLLLWLEQLEVFMTFALFGVARGSFGAPDSEEEVMED